MDLIDFVDVLAWYLFYSPIALGFIIIILSSLVGMIWIACEIHEIYLEDKNSIWMIISFVTFALSAVWIDLRGRGIL